MSPASAELMGKASSGLGQLFGWAIAFVMGRDMSKTEHHALGGTARILRPLLHLEQLAKGLVLAFQHLLFA